MSKVGIATKDELLEAKPELDKIFYSSDFVMGSLPKFWSKVKEQTDISYRVTKGYYDNQAVVQMFKRVQKPQREYPIQTPAPLKVIFMDTMVIDSFYLINTIDLFSKFVSSSVFRKPVNSNDAVKALKQFLDEADVDLKDIGEIRCDGGPEFHGTFATYTEGLTVKALPYAKTQMSPVERFNGTLRRMLEKLKAVEGKPISWAFHYVPQCVRAYNNLTHSSTKYTPHELLHNKDAQRKVLSQQKSVPKIDGVTSGDTVRVNIRDQLNPFDRKIAPNWSEKLYPVKSVKGNTVTLEDGKQLQGHQVIVIDPELLMTRKVRIQEPQEKSQDERRIQKRVEKERKQISATEDVQGKRSRKPAFKYGKETAELVD